MSTNQVRLIRIEEVKAISGLKRSTIYAYISDGIFPSQIKLGKRCAAWIESEVLVFLRARIAGRTEQEIKELVQQLLMQRQQLSYQ